MVSDQINTIFLHFTPWKSRFWYQKKAHIYLIKVKFEAQIMFHFDVINKKQTDNFTQNLE